MALSSAKYEAIHDRTGSDLAAIKANFDNGQHLTTIDFPAADFSANPYFAVSGDAFNINVDEYAVTIEDFSLSGDFAPDGSYIDGVTLIGSIDTRPLVPLLGDETAAEDAICVLAATLNIQCEACSDGSGDFCLSLEADSISAPLVPMFTFAIPQSEPSGPRNNSDSRTSFVKIELLRPCLTEFCKLIASLRSLNGIT